MKIEVIHHASIRLEDDKVIYFDPYEIEEERHDADYIFITHDHYDHYDLASIEKVRKASTKIVVPKCLREKEHFLVVEPNKEYQLDSIYFSTVPAYNKEKSYHPKEKEYVGYLLSLKDTTYYIMGDTDRTVEADKIKCDVCFVPIGGVYTMDLEEAVTYVNDLAFRTVIPIHYGKIVGDEALGEQFKEKVKNSEVILMIKENRK